MLCIMEKETNESLNYKLEDTCASVKAAILDLFNEKSIPYIRIYLWCGALKQITHLKVYVELF